MTDDELEREVVQKIFGGKPPSPDFRPSLNVPDAHLVLSEIEKQGFKHRFEPQVAPDPLRQGKISVVAHAFSVQHVKNSIRVGGVASASEARHLPRLICTKCLEALALSRALTPSSL